jgi:hypothetical protein
VVLNDGLHEQCCCRMVARLRHLSPICPPCMRRSGTDFVVDDVSQQLRTQDSRLGLSQGETSRGGGERGGDWDTVLCLALRMAVRAGFVHVSVCFAVSRMRAARQGTRKQEAEAWKWDGHWAPSR